METVLIAREQPNGSYRLSFDGREAVVTAGQYEALCVAIDAAGQRIRDPLREPDLLMVEIVIPD